MRCTSPVGLCLRGRLSWPYRFSIKARVEAVWLEFEVGEIITRVIHDVLSMPRRPAYGQPAGRFDKVFCLEISNHSRSPLTPRSILRWPES